MRSSPNYFLLTGHHDPPARRKLCMQRLIHAQGLFTLADKIGMVFGTSKLKKLYGDNFCFEEMYLHLSCTCYLHDSDAKGYESGAITCERLV